MTKRFQGTLSLAFLGVCLSLCGCTMKTPEHLANVQVGNGDATNSSVAAVNKLGERVDIAAEEVIGNDSLKAWRKAVSHHRKPDNTSQSQWKTERDADEQSAMDQLKDLAKRYPMNSTVRFMMGQVEEEFGKHAEAIKYFHESVAKNTTNGMALFKLAQTEREAGNTSDAIKHYQELLKIEPQWYAAKLGLAECFLKSDPAQAHQLAQQVADDKSTDAVSLKRAQQIVNETKGSKSTG